MLRSFAQPRRLLGLTAACLLACSGGRDHWIAELQATRPEDRALAVKKLADRFDSDDLQLFTQAAKDPVAIVRAEAMVALGKSSDPRVVDLLGEGLGDRDDQVQARAALALAGIRTEKARAYLTLQYGRRGRNTRIVIVQALKSANIPGAMASVVAAEAAANWERNLKSLTTGSLPERVGAAEALGRSGRPEAVNRLVPLLKDNQVVLAAAAARGLGEAGDRRAVPALLDQLDENFPELREAAAEALGHLDEPSALPRLVAAAQEHASASAAATRAIAAMARSGDTDKALCELAQQGGAEAGIAGREMRRRGGCPLESVGEKLKSPATAVAGLQAVIALGPAARELASKVAPLLTLPDATTRRLAADALVELDDASTAPAVLKALEAELKALEPLRSKWIPGDLQRRYGPGFDPDQPLPSNDPASVIRGRTSDLFRRVQALDEKRAQAAGKVALTQLPPHELVDDLSDEQVRPLAALARAAGRLKADGSRALLEPLTHELSPTLRGAAFAGLAGLGPEGVALARSGLLDPDRLVQSGVAQSLAETSELGRAALVETMGSLAGDRTRLLGALRTQPLPASAMAVLLAIVKEGGGEAALAASLLGEAQTAEAAAPIIALLNDQNTVARLELISALTHLRDPKVVEALGRELYSDSPEVRAAAAESLGVLGAGPHLEALDALKGDYALRVRNVAAAALARLSPGDAH